jgi:hypothetical protein
MKTEVIWPEGFIERGADLSDCELYRYRLTRNWSAARPAIFVMLNPSTADATVDDRTIGRCMSFARSWGCGGIFVLNLFAFRATNPKVMAEAADPIGPDNDGILRLLQNAIRFRESPVVAAWGSHPMAAARAAEVYPIFGAMKALAINKDGAPKHPLYVKGDAQLVDWEPRQKVTA